MLGRNIRSSTPTNQETLNNNTEGEAGGEGRKNLPRRCSSPRACGLRNPPPATKPDKSNQSSTDGEREPKRKHEVEGRGADLGDVDRGGHQGGGDLRGVDRGGGGRAYPLAREGAGDDEGDVDGVAAHHHAVEHVEEAHRGGGRGSGRDGGVHGDGEDQA